MTEARSERPVGARPPEERSDWTEQDLLTVDEALPRLLDAIAEAERDAGAVTDPEERRTAERRLAAMHEARGQLEANRAARRSR
ncbi:hypothetical protein [Pseudonocardia kunmingensis]|uniref:Uncharacterized protein n=1 Tax=Pseudonocardia kunmingensis TaxID=630975 RepID=A0A543DPM7_9PSEU|nr:hypothetical protein [Pseudonocardia kunmingensis]TQM11253.1 hypothetical protein FB558_3810 [Pseudonocardia kunmingensis]